MGNQIINGVERSIAPCADLHGADLRGANLCWANLHGANLHGANLHGADLHGADLRGADLCWADLHGANLHGVDLRGANLYGADLYEADLHGADLSKALFAVSEVFQATWGVLSDQLTADLMRYDAANHPNPHDFFEWSENRGPCPYPYGSVTVQRAVNFTEKRGLWPIGKDCRPWDLMIRLFQEARVTYEL